MIWYCKITVFVYDQLQKSLSSTFDNYFHKTTDHHSHNARGEKLNIPINKTSTVAFNRLRQV